MWNGQPFNESFEQLDNTLASAEKQLYPFPSLPFLPSLPISPDNPATGNSDEENQWTGDEPTTKDNAKTGKLRLVYFTYIQIS